MEYFLFLSILYILPLFTEEHLVLKPDKDGQKSRETLQLEPDEKLSGSAEVNALKDNKNKLTESKALLQSSEKEEVQEDSDTEDRKQLKNPGEVLKEDKEESDPGSKADNQEGMVFLLQVPTKFRGKMPLKFDDKDKMTHWKRWLSEIAAGHNSEISGTNPRIYQPDEHPTFTRSFGKQHFNPEANAAQLKKMWQNLKTKARDAKTLEAQKKWTGGGPAPPAIGSEETQVLSILPTIMPTIEVQIDSDIIQSSTSQFSETNDDDGVYWQNKKNRMMDMEVHVLGEEVQDINTLPGCSLQGLTMPTTPELAPAPAKKRKPEQSLDDLKKELVKKEIEKVTKQIEQDEEKHAVELEILKLKRDLLKKELNKN